MAVIAAIHGEVLVGVPSERMLMELAIAVLGPYAGYVICISVSLACLTTAISLALVFSEFLSKDVLKSKISYRSTLILTLLVSFVISF